MSVLGGLENANVPAGKTGPETHGHGGGLGDLLVLQSGLPLYLAGGVPVSADGLSGREHLAKRSLDIVLSGTALVVLAPFLFIVALALKVTGSGPVLFAQSREGRGGRLFLIYKFRTMAAGTQTVTRLGHLLRRTSVDELPQLLNVLRGEMSLVGPRPHVPGMQAGGMPYRELVPYYDKRLSLLPGLTGWAQVNGLRGSVSDAALARSRVDHDVAYIQNASLWLDIRIIGRTLVREFLRGTGS